MSKKGLEFIGLDECVINALELFKKVPVPSLDFISFKRPLVVGSQNAAVTGRIIFGDSDGVFADESTYESKLSNIPDIDGVVLISSSGGKHAPIIAREARKRGKEVVLLTNNPDAPAKMYASKTKVFPKTIEPYTYNTSTYMGMILAKTHESPQEIMKLINKVKAKIPKNFKKFDAFYIIVPERLESIRDMFFTKFDELFGPKVSARVYTSEQTKHAKTIVQSDKEMFISFGYDNKIFGTKRLNIPFPENASYASLMALGYYVIGQIQKQHPPYFKKGIVKYCEEATKVYGQKIEPWVM